MSKKDGGPAFPIITNDMPVTGSPGLSLRDYFAAKAMQGQISVVKNEGGIWNPVFCAQWAYEFADAMLAEREKERR